jgi:hypothetical protein
MTIIKHEFVYTTADGKPAIGIHEWVRTLPEEDRKKYEILDDERHLQTVELVESGKLSIGDDGAYIWHDPEAESTFEQEINPGWVAFWERYLKETGQKFEVKKSAEE